MDVVLATEKNCQGTNSQCVFVDREPVDCPTYCQMSEGSAFSLDATFRDVGHAPEFGGGSPPWPSTAVLSPDLSASSRSIGRCRLKEDLRSERDAHRLRSMTLDKRPRTTSRGDDVRSSIDCAVAIADCCAGTGAAPSRHVNAYRASSKIIGNVRGPRTVPSDHLTGFDISSLKSGMRFSHSSMATVISIRARFAPTQR